MFKNVFKCALTCAILAVIGTATAFAQDEKVTVDRSKIPASADSPNAFVPPGWKIEEKVSGDLNGDGKADLALKLIQDKPGNTQDQINERGRALIILFAGGKAGYRLAAVTDTLLQCTGCGGAFYGIVDAPANVSIEKGVIVVSQDHGSREVTETTYRFRYDEQPAMFILIGFDYASRDRAAGGVWTESTNYLTGKRVTTVDKGKRRTTKTTVVAKNRMSIEEVDAEKLEGEATHRLGLD
jgi:hypothetical protein